MVRQPVVLVPLRSALVGAAHTGRGRDPDPVRGPAGAEYGGDHGQSPAGGPGCSARTTVRCHRGLARAASGGFCPGGVNGQLSPRTAPCRRDRHRGRHPRPGHAAAGAGPRPAPRARSALLGPAFVASVAYVDPGNFATNFAGGATHGYQLVWVIVMADLMAILVQYLTSKAGLATGRNLPELCRERFGRRANMMLWLQAEVIAMATDLAEFVGAAIGINLLFGVPLFPAGLITAVVAFVILGLEQRGYRRFELAIIALLGLVGLRLRVPVFRRRRPELPAARRGPAAPHGRHGHPRPDGRDHRRDGHAARGLPALSPANRPGPRGRARSSAAPCWPTTNGTASSAWASPGWSTCPCCASPPPCSTNPA